MGEAAGPIWKCQKERKESQREREKSLSTHRFQVVLWHIQVNENSLASMQSGTQKWHQIIHLKQVNKTKVTDKIEKKIEIFHTRARLTGFFKSPGCTQRWVDDVMTVSKTTRLLARNVVPVAELSKIASEKRKEVREKKKSVWEKNEIKLERGEAESRREREREPASSGGNTSVDPKV